MKAPPQLQQWPLQAGHGPSCRPPLGVHITRCVYSISRPLALVMAQLGLKSSWAQLGIRCERGTRWLFTVCLLGDACWTPPSSIFPWQLRPILWPRMRPARPTNAPSPSPPDQRSCGFSLSPTKGTVPEGSRSRTWPTTVSAVKLRLQNVEGASLLWTEPTSGPAGGLLTCTQAQRGRKDVADS